MRHDGRHALHIPAAIRTEAAEKEPMTDFSSRTARIPPRHHKRAYTISKHAVDRFRERVDEEFRHREDEDLSNLLDARVKHAESSYEVRDPRAPDEITNLRSVACRHATYWAVVRGSTVVTVLDEEMAKNNFNGQWATVLNTPFTALRNLKLPTTAKPPPALTPVLVKMEGKNPVVQNQAEIAEAKTDVAARVADASEELDPLVEAGVAYARARKRKHACGELVVKLRAELQRAEEELQAAALDVNESHRRLVDLTGGEELP